MSNCNGSHMVCTEFLVSVIYLDRHATFLK